MDQDHWRFISLLLPSHDKYHNDKERMAYAVAVVHIGAMAAAAATMAWKAYPNDLVFIFLILELATSPT